MRADQERGFRRDDWGRTPPVRDMADKATGASLGTTPVVSSDFEADVQVISTGSTTMSESAIGIELVRKPIQERWRTIEHQGRHGNDSWFLHMHRTMYPGACDCLYETVNQFEVWHPGPMHSLTYTPGRPHVMGKRNYYRHLIERLAGIVATRAVESVCSLVVIDEDDHQWVSRDIAQAGLMYALAVEQIGTYSLMTMIRDSHDFMRAVENGDVDEAAIADKASTAELISAWRTVCGSIPECVAELIGANAA